MARLVYCLLVAVLLAVMVCSALSQPLQLRNDTLSLRNDTFSNVTLDDTADLPAITPTDIHHQLLMALDTSRLTPQQRRTLIAAELAKVEDMTGEQLSAKDRRSLVRELSAWLNKSAEEKLAFIREQQRMRAMDADDEMQLRARAAEELRASHDENVDDERDDARPRIRRVRLIRVGRLSDM